MGKAEIALLFTEHLFGSSEKLVRLDNMNITLPYHTGTRFVLNHPENGVYIGDFLGLGFWSNLETAGQDSAVTFNSEAEAMGHAETWPNPEDREGLQAIALDTDGQKYATIAQLEAAGLPSWQVKK